MPDKSIISRVIDWLSVGYPKDVPVQDRAAVMAILKMRLTDEQLQEVVRQLMQSRAARGEAYVSDQRINEYIRRVVDHTPTPQDIDRVAKILGAHGFLIAENHVNEDAEPTTGGTEYVTYDDPTTGEIRIAELAAQEELDSIRPDLDGGQIMQILGIAPGPVVGEAYKFLLNLRLDEGSLPEEEAKARLLQWWEQRREA